MSCGPVTPIPVTKPSIATTTYNPPEPIITGTPSMRVERTDYIQISRNGKSYKIFGGYSVIYITPFPTPQINLGTWEHLSAHSSADIKLYGDFDKDGEVEFIVSFYSCEHSCSEEIRIYKYDPTNDDFVVAASFVNTAPAVKEYGDFDHDGNPEILTAGYGFCYLCSTFESSGAAAIKVLRYQNEKFADVTREFPDLLEKDANHFLEIAKGDAPGALLTLPSYLYDMYRLNKIEFANQVFEEVCTSTIKEKILEFDCTKYRKEVATYIEFYELHDVHQQ